MSGAEPPGAPRASSPDLSDGTHQGERAQPALAPGYAQVDDRSLEELLKLLSGVASNLAWVDRGNRRDQQEGWGDLYLQNDLGVLADMASVDVQALKRRVGAAVGRGHDGEQADAALRIAERIDGWHRVLRRSQDPVVAELGSTLRRIIESDLAPALGLVGDAVAAGATGLLASDELWGIGKAGSAAPAGKATSLPDGPVSPAARAHETLLNACAYLAPAGREALASLLRSGRNDPSLGLIVAFLQLFIQARRELNTFPRRRLDFYYQDLLGMKPRGLIPDHAHLLLRTAPGTPWLELPAGTEFSAGRDEDQKELLYATREAVSVTDARVVALRALEYERDPLISPERELGFVTRVLAASAEDPAPGLEDGEPIGVFGGAGGGATLSPAGGSLGFAVAGPILALAGGTRRLSFDIILGDALGGMGSTLDEAIEILDGVVAGDVEGFFRSFGRIVCGALFHRPSTTPGLEEGRWCTPSQRERIRARGQIVLGKELETLLWMVESRLSPDQAQAIRGVAGLVADSPVQSGEDPEVALNRILERDPVRLSPDQQEMIRAVVGELRASLEVMTGAMGSDPRSVLQRFFADALVVRFTGPTGWVEVQDLHVALLDGEGGGGLQVEMTLGPQVGPVVAFDPALHGTTFDGSEPVMGFRLNPRAMVHPYSFLDCLALVRIDVVVQVRGVTDLVVQNALGLLDPSRPFHPFGPLPARDSYLVVGSFEAARKTLVEASLEVVWGGLPDLPGGLRQHYFGYGQDITNEAFRSRISLLRDGRWEPLDPALAMVSPLFTSRGEGEGTAPTVRIPLGPIALWKPVDPGTPRAHFASMLHARQGLFRLSLAASEVTFGHQEYPRLLTDVLTRNARRRRQDPLPNPPYTPLVNRVTMDYTARTTIYPGARDDVATSGSPRERILHEHPFGMEDLTASVDEQVYSLMPGRPLAPASGGEPRHRDGYFFIGLRATELPGALSLLFHLRHDAMQDPVVEDPGATWFYLRSNRWYPLSSSRLLGDTTGGFQRSGIVSLDIPADIDAESTILPRGMFWLGVGVNRRIRSLISRLMVVSAGGVQVTWQDRGNRRRVENGLPSRSITGPVTRVPGLASVLQVGESFGGRGAEDEEELVTRTAERLRHRKRAVSAWDYERLVLDRFPEVGQVKVFPNTDTRYDVPRPGSVLVVVVPHPGSEEEDQPFTPRFSGGELIQVRDYLRSLSPGSARLYVQNPVYELIQVRCVVSLARGVPPGQSLRHVNAVVVDHLSPWRPGGYGSRFGWRIRRKDVESRIRAIPWVESVSSFSMLQVTMDSRGRYRLDDTARLVGFPEPPPEIPSPTSVGAPELRARYRWSLAVPTRRHAIETNLTDQELEAEVTGLGSLEIGTNFILEAGHHHG